MLLGEKYLDVTEQLRLVFLREPEEDRKVAFESRTPCGVERICTKALAPPVSKKSECHDSIYQSGRCARRCRLVAVALLLLRFIQRLHQRQRFEARARDHRRFLRKTVDVGSEKRDDLFSRAVRASLLPVRTKGRRVSQETLAGAASGCICERAGGVRRALSQNGRTVWDWPESV